MVTWRYRRIPPNLAALVHVDLLAHQCLQFTDDVVHVDGVIVVQIGELEPHMHVGPRHFHPDGERIARKLAKSGLHGLSNQIVLPDRRAPPDLPGVGKLTESSLDCETRRSETTFP